MSELLDRVWRSSLGGSGLSRRDRQPCSYSAYVPDPLVGRPVTLEGLVAADVADAEAAIARLDMQARALANTEALARILLRAESVASSRIEGLSVGARRLLHADAARNMLGDRRSDAGIDVTAHEVLNNIDATAFAVEQVGEGAPITLELLLATHARLLAGTQLAQHGVQLREVQNWIGGSSFNPCWATFVPPPPEAVHGLMADLCAFCNDDALSPVTQAALAHAQFETIHPFVDGNGRTGRALIHLVLRRRGLARRVLPPISLVLGTMADSYVDGLGRYRYDGSPDSPQALEGTNTWVGRFAAACTRSVADAVTYEENIAELEASWRARLGIVRANSATDQLLKLLPGAPVLTVDAAAKLLGRSFNPANQAIDRLADAGIVKQITVGRRNRAYEAPEVIAAFTALERQLASPGGDTHTSRPARRVPARR